MYGISAILVLANIFKIGNNIPNVNISKDIEIIIKKNKYTNLFLKDEFSRDNVLITILNESK